MSMNQPALERTVRRHTDDIGEMYEMLSTIDGRLGRQSRRLRDISNDILLTDAKVTALGDRVGVVEGRLDGIDGRLGGIDGRLGGVEGRLDGIDGRLDGMDTRFDQIDGRLDGIDGRLGGVEGQLGEVLEILRRP